MGKLLKAEKSVINALRNKNISVDKRDFCLYVKNKWENWIVELVEVDGNKIRVKLYHEDIVFKGPNKNCKYPDMHLQFDKWCTPGYLASYIDSHLKKYNKNKWYSNEAFVV